MTSAAAVRMLGEGSWFDPATSSLRGSVCTVCAAPSFPPRAFCWRCSGPMRPQLLPRSGRVVARSRVRVSPPGFPDTYDVGVVELAPGLRVLARFGGEAPDRGGAVTVHCGHLRDDDDGPVFGPVFVDDPSARPQVSDRGADLPEPPARISRGGPLGVTVAGVATTAFGRPDLPAEELAAQAALAATADAGLAATDVDAVVVGSAFSTAALGQKMLRHVPWGGRRLVNVENACASGTSALAEAVALVRAGFADVVVAVGADTPVRSGGGLIPLDREDPVAGIGVTLPALYALVGDRYLAAHGVGPDAFAEVVVRSRDNATRNVDAFRRSPVTRDEVLGSRAIADPLTLFQCAPNADGAAAVVVVADHLRAHGAHPPVEIASLALNSGFTKDRFTGGSVVERVSRAVYAQAGIHPSEIGVVELHDAFAPAALTNLENLGLAEPGTAATRLLAGGFRGGASGPALNPSGGLLSRGHPPGATGLAQVTELVRQLRGEAGDRQLSDPGVALLQTMGGTVLELETNACTIGVLRRSR
ncbi:MAG: Propanoyl-CoA acyltransferase [Frankiales bacterium]|nr:Propanoyl-CoA acyltransferase [Frankiales bacterium]